jgi:hypothetical protein
VILFLVARGEFRARYRAGQFGPAIRPRRGASGLYHPQSQEPHAPPRSLRGDARRQHPHHAAQFAVPAHRGARRRLPPVGRRRPRIHRRAGRIHRRHLRPLPSGDPRRHRPRAESWLELRRAQRQRGQACQAGGRPHAVDRPGALHQLRDGGQRHGARRRARLCPTQGPHQGHQGHGVPRRLPRRRALFRERRQPGERALRVHRGTLQRRRGRARCWPSTARSCSPCCSSPCRAATAACRATSIS